MIQQCCIKSKGMLVGYNFSLEQRIETPNVLPGTTRNWLVHAWCDLELPWDFPCPFGTRGREGPRECCLCVVGRGNPTGLPIFPSGPWDGKDQGNMASLMGHGNPMGLPMFPSGPWDGKDQGNSMRLPIFPSGPGDEMDQGMFLVHSGTWESHGTSHVFWDDRNVTWEMGIPWDFPCYPGIRRWVITMDLGIL